MQEPLPSPTTTWNNIACPSKSSGFTGWRKPNAQWNFVDIVDKIKFQPCQCGFSIGSLKYSISSVFIDNYRHYEIIQKMSTYLSKPNPSKALLRPRDAVAHGRSRQYLAQLARKGLLQKVARGLYALPQRQATEFASLAEIASKYPKAQVCLLSALAFHGLTTQAPFEVWIAVDNKARAPSLDYPPMRIARFSGSALTEGVELHDIEGIPVRVTSVAKTIADCFKYRNKIGLDVALEALKDAWRDKRVTMDELWHFGKICRVHNVMQPYLEGLST
jgi:hypothetical protein